MSHLSYPANLESPLGDGLRCIRLRHSIPRWVGKRWIHVSVKQRAEDQTYELSRMKRRDYHPKRWQPAEGRESPREDWMSWRRSLTRYAYAGWMQYFHGKGPPLAGRANLYGPCPGPRASYLRPAGGTRTFYHTPFRPHR